MEYTEYVKINNLLKIYEFYGKPITAGNMPDSMWIARTLFLLNALCDLEYQEKYPKTSGLDDVITFFQENPSAEKIKKYLDILPGYNESLGVLQSHATYQQHAFLTMSFMSIKDFHNEDISERCTLNLDYQYILKKDAHGHYLDIVDKGYTTNLTKLLSDPDKTFRVNGLILNDLELDDVINIITYGNHVKSISRDNIQAAYSFLH